MNAGNARNSRQSTQSPSTVHYEEDFNQEGTRALKSAIAALRDNPDTSDVRIICDGKEFPAHKVILSAHSDVFKAMFSHSGTREHESGRVTITDCDQGCNCNSIDNLDTFLDILWVFSFFGRAAWTFKQSFKAYVFYYKLL